MTTHRQRAASPQAPRVYLDTPRASTGTVLTTSYDTRFDTRPRNSFSAVPVARDTLGSRNPVYETQPVSKKTYVDSAHGATISRTQYAIRPRKDSDVAETRRPLNVVTKNVSPTRDRAGVVDSPQQMVVYKSPREDSNTSRYLQPAQVRGSPHHQRHSSASRADIDRLQRAHHPSRPEKEYVKRGPYVEKVADSRPPPIRYSDDDGFSYTGPREQFARDYPVKPSRRESVNRKERPISAIDLRLEQPSRRDTAPLPPPPSRQLKRLERDERKSGFESDPDRSRVERTRRQAPRGPIVHQRDDGYVSADHDTRRVSRIRPQDDNVTVVGKSRYQEPPRDLERERDRERVRKDYDREHDRPPERDREREKGTRRHREHKDREYERERTRPKEYETIEEDEPPRRSHRRESSPDRTGLKALATAAVGGLAAAGIAGGRKSGKDDDDNSTSDSRRERKHRRRKSKDPRDEEKRDLEEPEPPRRRRERKSNRDESSGSDTSSEKSRRRPQSRTRTRRDTNDGYGSERERPQLALPAPPEPERRPSTRELEPSINAPAPQSHPEQPSTDLDLVPIRTRQDSPTTDEGRTLSPGENADPRPRKVSIVEPTRKEEFRPKGILKKPREVPFPEDPNPTREGVAPLKQAGKDGIPTGARWTKVSRILVNPEALEKSHERFEERDDYVIVLRVLSREEIEKLAEKTKQIREQREREWQKEVEERRRRRSERGERDSEHEDDYDDAPRGPLAIEAPPVAPPADLRQLAAAQNTSQPPPPQQQQGYPPQFPWNSGTGGFNRSSGEAIANTAPGQAIPVQQQPQQQQQQQQPEFDTSTYSQNV